MGIVCIILAVVCIILFLIILQQEKDLDIEMAINDSSMDKLNRLHNDLELMRKENQMLQDELDKMPKAEKVSKPRGRKPGSKNKKTTT